MHPSVETTAVTGRPSVTDGPAPLQRLADWLVAYGQYQKTPVLPPVLVASLQRPVVRSTPRGVFVDLVRGAGAEVA